MLGKYVSLPVFFVSFIFGLISVYAIGPEIKTVYVYPSPTNNTKIQYKDGADQCFQIAPKVTHCPINPLSVKTIPIQ